MPTQTIHSIESFLSPAECHSTVEAIEAIGFKNQYSGSGRLIRSRADFHDSSLSDLIWGRLRNYLPRLADVYAGGLQPEPAVAHPLESYAPAHLNELFRCYKYGVDEEFRRHQDFAHEYSNEKRTFLTVLIYLNDDYTGGETAFDGLIVVPQKGMLTFFQHELEHEGCKVTTGIKYTLRTDVVYESKGPI